MFTLGQANFMLRPGHLNPRTIFKVSKLFHVKLKSQVLLLIRNLIIIITCHHHIIDIDYQSSGFISSYVLKTKCDMSYFVCSQNSSLTRWTCQSKLFGTISTYIEPSLVYKPLLCLSILVYLKEDHYNSSIRSPCKKAFFYIKLKKWSILISC